MDESTENETRLSSHRPSSPSPSIPATPAISACPSFDRTFSTISSLSTASSAPSVDARSISSSSKRRGYIRPQGVEFAKSAKARESVMCLGSIAHLQYYFARTGLLDGRGGNSREWKKRKSSKPEDVPRLLITPNEKLQLVATEGHTNENAPTVGEEEANAEEAVAEGEMESEDEFNAYDDMMLPPTVSTYSLKTHYVPPPPDTTCLRKDLSDALDRAEEGIQAMDNHGAESRPLPSALLDDSTTDDTINRSPQMLSETPGWDKIQGMHVLDVLTLAIRAAKIYYTSHEYPERLSALKPVREIRRELLCVLEVLKRWASRQFAGGLRIDERVFFQGWINDARCLLAREEEQEDAEGRELERWEWLHANWTGREREREESFLQSLMEPGTAPLPPWTPADAADQLPTPFLERLRDGRDLVQMHNQAVKKSKRRFCQIENYHLDVGKPYRRAENMRYWMKAAEIRWERKLEVNVTDVVQGNNPQSWKQFEAALLSWCQCVRDELARDWKERKSK